MGYRINSFDGFFRVVEFNNGESRTIAVDKSEEKMRKVHKHLNTGGAFNGWTPEFFMNRLQVNASK